MTVMTHRERVITALAHRQPDRVPLDFGTGNTTSPVPEFYCRLAAAYGFGPGHARVPASIPLAAVDERILVDLDIDTRPVYMGTVRRGLRASDRPDRFYDDWGVQRRVVDVGSAVYHEFGEHPLATATVESLDHYPWWPDPLDPARYEGVRAEAERLYRETDYALVGCPAFSSLWERAWYLCGFERMLVSLLDDPAFVHAVMRRVTELTKLSLDRFLTDVGQYIQVIKMMDDLGGQRGPLMSVKTYRSILKPYHQDLFAFIKQRTHAAVFFHSCGSVYRFLPDLIDAGVDILNPVQVSVVDMDTRKLKAEFGDRLSFWGGIDTQHVLPRGTTGDVEQEVGRRIADLGSRGGYVLAPVHNIQADVPVENVLTMYRHARRVT